VMQFNCKREIPVSAGGAVFKCLVCNILVSVPTPEPKGKYDVTCPHCGQVWGFSNFPDTAEYRRTQK